MSPEVSKQTLETEDEPAKVEKAERGRSRIEWPYFNLDEALKLARGIHELGGHCQVDQLAGRLNQSATGGAFRLKIQAARTFGLITSAQGVLSLTELGSRIIEPDYEREARVEAFMKVPLYTALYEHFKNKTLPGIEGLENAMVNLGVVPKQKDKARQAFQRSAKEAGFFAFGATKLVYPVLAPDKGNKSTDVPTPSTSLTSNQNGSADGKTGTSGGGNGSGLDPLIQGLLNKLPDPTVPWTLDGRKKWLQLALSVLDVMYTGAEDGKSLIIKIDEDSAN